MKRYCSECGKECIRELVGAETVRVYSFEGNSYRLAAPFDKKTGKRNLVEQFTCPEYLEKKWWQYTDHDNYTLDKIINN